MVVGPTADPELAELPAMHEGALRAGHLRQPPFPGAVDLQHVKNTGGHLDACTSVVPHMRHAPNLRAQPVICTKCRLFGSHIDKSLQRPEITPLHSQSLT